MCIRDRVEGFRSAATQRVLAGEVGSKVTLWIEDPVTKETITVTREIRLAQPAGAPGGK